MNLQDSIMIFYKQLGKICDIRFGIAEQSSDDGEIAYVQISQFNDQGIRNDEKLSYLKTSKKIQAHLLQDGDLLFAGKGNKLFAWAYTDEMGPAIASSSFFILRPLTKSIDVKYMEAYLNSPQAKLLFLQIGAGTNIFSIRKSELAAFQIPMLPIQQQKRIAAVSALHQKEVEIAQTIIEQKQNLYTAIISKLIK